MSDYLKPLTIGGQMHHAVSAGFPHPDHVAEVRLSLRPRSVDPETIEKLDQMLGQHPSKRDYRTHNELEEYFGHDPDDVSALEKYFEGHHLQFKPDRPLACGARVKGSVKFLEKAFGVRLELLQLDHKNKFLGHRAPLHLPPEHHPQITGISGLNPSPIKANRIRHSVPQTDPSIGKGYTVAQISEAYQFPELEPEDSPCIGLIELGGRYSDSDLIQFFKENGLRMPTITTVGDPGTNTNESLLDDVEVTVDIEVAGALIAPVKKTGTKSEVVIYFAPTIAEAMQLAISDETNKPSVISCSWAAPETNYSTQELAELHRVFYLAALLGITVLGASGDTGAYEGKSFPVVTIPAAHPLVLGVGGTQIKLAADDSIENEVVWNENQGKSASGGGFSRHYPLPKYQEEAVFEYPYRTSNSRGVPDIAANAAESSGYRVVFHGQTNPIGGTSLATPLWAGLIARLNGQLGYRLGYVHPWFYEQFRQDSFRAIVEGNNQLYPAYPGWNACTGLGSPVGTKLLEALRESEPRREKANN